MPLLLTLHSSSSCLLCLASSSYSSFYTMEQDPNPFLRHCKGQSNNSGSSRPLIPGPAGAIQAAMYARRSTPNTPLIPTQEIVRRVLDHGSTETDPDFNSHAWLSALQEWGIATPLGSLTANVERVENVVAVIKSCTPNGFGDAKVTLKVCLVLAFVRPCFWSPLTNRSNLLLKRFQKFRTPRVLLMLASTARHLLTVNLRMT